MSPRVFNQMVLGVPHSAKMIYMLHIGGGCMHTYHVGMDKGPDVFVLLCEVSCD